MKKLFLLLMCFGISLSARAQTTTFPAQELNNIFTGTNNFNGITNVNLQTYTVGTLPTPATVTTGYIVLVTDGSTPNNCTTGSGSNLSFCRNTGSAWVPIGVNPAAPGAIGGTTPAAGTFTSITDSGSLTFVEGSAPTGSSGNDVCAGVSSVHRIQCSMNNGTVSSLATLADIATAISTVYSTISASTTGNIGATTMFTTTADSTYRFSFYGQTTVVGTSCTSQSFVTVNVTWQDPLSGSANTMSFVNTNLTDGTTFNGVVGPMFGWVSSSGTSSAAGSPTQVVFRAKSGTNITYSTTANHGGNCAPAPSYKIVPLLEQMTTS